MPDRIRPYEQLGESYRSVLLGYLDSLRAQASPEDWNTSPEIIRTGNRIQFIARWSAGSEKVTYSFSFVLENGAWYFQHLETIFIRLDKVGEFPVSHFPDISEQQKNWVREELYWSFIVTNVYLPAVKDRGKDAALNMLKDGAGYFVAARVWVPFSPPHETFILYLSWEQANLRGNKVTLVKMDDTAAVVKLTTHYFSLYSIAAHLKPLISIDDYKQIFETIWQDRASNAGWHLDIEYSSDLEVSFRFTRQG